MMNVLGRAFLRGLGVILPVSLTLYVIYAVAMASERMIGGAIQSILPMDWYWPGFGLLIAMAMILLIGFLVRVPVIKVLVRTPDWLFERMPVVRSVYSILKDFVDFMSAPEGGEPVLVDLGSEMQVIGLLTNSTLQKLNDVSEGQVMVYIPMSYQIGGFSVILPKERITQLEMGMEDAMSFVVTAGIKKEE